MAEKLDFEPTEPAEQPTSIHDLTPKMQLTGRVTSIDLYGAFVDIGIGRDALVHISKLSSGAVNRVDEVLTVGDEVTVYVDRVDTQTGRVSLTMVKPLDVTWHDLKPGQVFNGTITRLEPYGAFVDIGAERPGLLHVSEFADEGIRHPSELYSVNQEISVRVVDYDRRRRRIDLGLARAGSDEASQEEEQPEEMPTAMEVALRQALEDTDSPLLPAPRKQRSQRRSRGRRRAVQDDILSRTLSSRKS